MGERLQCPLCLPEDTTAAGEHRLAVHILGHHLKTEGTYNSVKSQLQKLGKEHPTLVEKIVGLIIAELESLLTVSDLPASNSTGAVGGVESWDLKNYLDLGLNYKDCQQNHLIACREERQFAHYLAVCLQANVPEIKKALGFDGMEVHSVYFEATLVRDFWAAHRAAAINILIRYVAEKGWGEIVIEPPHIELHPRAWDRQGDRAVELLQALVNAKPDIGVLHRGTGDEGFGLSFLECKYKSPVSIHCELSQTELQEHILDVLCGEGGFGLTFHDRPVRSSGVRLVRFQEALESPRPTGRDDYCMSIPTLLASVKRVYDSVELREGQ